MTDMILTTPGFADLVIRPTIILALAAVGALAMHRLSAASRHFLWSAALCGVLAVPSLGPVAPGITVPVDAPVAGVLERAPWLSAAMPEVVAENARNAAASSASAEPAPGQAAPPFPWRTIWAAGCLGLLGVFGMRLATLRRLGRAARPAHEARLVDALEFAKQRLGVDRPVRLLLGEPTAMPMTWGHRTPRILLPGTAPSWPLEQTRAVLLHELAHVRRGDVLLQRVAELARAVFWFNPLAWYAARRMLVEREHACDDAVIRSGIRGSDYAHQLLAMAHSLRSARGAAAALPMARRSQMTGRLMAILDEGRRRPSPAGGAKLALTLGIGAALATGSVRAAPLEAGQDAGDASWLATHAADDDRTRNAPLARPAASGCWDSIGPGTNSNRNRDPGRITAEWRTSRCEGGLEIEGRATLRPDSASFARLHPGTRVRIGEKEKGVWRKIELVGTSGGVIERRGLLGDRSMRNDEIDAWLGSALPPMLRLTGVELEVDRRGSP